MRPSCAAATASSSSAAPTNSWTSSPTRSPPGGCTCTRPSAPSSTPPYKGPARVTGGPGTGKTVVALHRAHMLAKRR